MNDFFLSLLYTIVIFVYYVLWLLLVSVLSILESMVRYLVGSDLDKDDHFTMRLDDWVYSSLTKFLSKYED